MNPGADETLQSHEVLERCREIGLPLSSNLTMMLGEHFSHRTERRGCGYTQASRVLAEHVNTPPAADDFSDLKLFLEWESLRADLLCYRAGSSESRLQPLEFLARDCARAESRLFVQMLRDVLRRPAEARSRSLAPTAPEKLKIGTCPLAEQFFLEIAHGFVRRIGTVNVFHDQGQPLFIEKIGLGDNHSCISVVPLTINSVEVPAGSLLGVQYDEDRIGDQPSTAKGRGRWIAFERVEYFRFLRLTTLSVAPEHRRRAFSAHFDQQVAGGLFSPDVARIEQLMDYAMDERPR
ncbi:MAG: hypothetical protein AB7E72_02210 [Lysobacterales bacterium]